MKENVWRFFMGCAGIGAYHFCSLSIVQTSVRRLLLTAAEVRKKRGTQILCKN